jgi:hypothetical protein
MGYLQVESFLKIETGKESKLIFRLKRIRLEKFNMFGCGEKGSFCRNPRSERSGEENQKFRYHRK